MDNNLMLFEHEDFGQVRSVLIDGEPWFVLKDVCNVFGETHHRRVASRLDDDEKGVTQIDTPGGLQNMTVINESGLYSTLFAMQPEKARGVSDEYIELRTAQLKTFKRWVTSEVLPSIRQTGAYSLEQKKTTNVVVPNEVFAQIMERIEQMPALMARVETIARQTSYNNYYLRLQMRSGYNERWEENASKKIDMLAKFLGWDHKQVLHEIYKSLRNDYGFNLEAFCKDYRAIKDVKYCSTLSVISYSEQLRYSFDHVINEALQECGIEFDSSDTEPSILMDAIRQKTN